MSRLLLLSILVLWMSRRDNDPPVGWDAAVLLGVFLGVYAVLVGVMSAWSRALARRVADDFLGRTLDRYNRATEIARYFVPVWFAVGIFGLGWGRVVYDLLAFLEPAGAGGDKTGETYWLLPGVLLGTLPAMAAWMGLWWAQYPADRALKEQSVLYQANEGLPIHAPPGFGTFFVDHFRQQLMFTLAPFLVIITTKDFLALAFLLFGGRLLPHGDFLFVPITLVVYALVPELLRRIIPTTPLPPEWPLRRRLEALCARAGLGYRDILLWQTNSSMGNAMVMGLFAPVRYVFLSDLLVETMNDDEIEAVFAHEIGHVVHRHMWWYVVFTITLLLLLAGPVTLLMNQVPALSSSVARQDQVATVLAFGLFIGLFGFLSRRFERQADVYAARTMQATHERGSVQITHVNPDPQVAAAAGGVFVHGLATANLGPAAPAVTGVPPMLSYESAAASHVGEYGAAVVAGALHRVARINNIPVAAHEWLHGSIESRMRYLRGIAGDAEATVRFDKYMRRLYWGLLSVFFMLMTYAIASSFIPGS